jgi:hypothetical protein
MNRTFTRMRRLELLSNCYQTVCGRHDQMPENLDFIGRAGGT